jgi:hypothetical protein
MGRFVRAPPNGGRPLRSRFLAAASRTTSPPGRIQPAPVKRRWFVLDAPVASLIPASAELPPEDVPLPEPEAENDCGERDQ